MPTGRGSDPPEEFLDGRGVNVQSGVSVEQFLTQRQYVLEALATIRRVAEQAGASNAADEAQRAAANLKDDAFRICVVGAFSRGKSTVINAMLGDRVLPSKSQPTTAILTLISYAEQPHFLLRFHDRRRPRKLSGDEFHALVAPPEPSPGDRREEREYRERLARLADIRQAEVGYPFPLCRDAVLVVDTPGTNDLDPRREQITYEFIPQSDAIIFVLSAKMAVSEDEVFLLRDRVFPHDIQRLFLVVNFADALETEGERRKVMRHAEHRLEGVIAEPRLYLVSAKSALRIRRGQEPGAGLAATGIPEFEADLTRFLLQERAGVKLAKPLSRGLDLCDELERGPLPLIEQTATLSFEELRARVRALAGEIQALRAERDSAISDLRAALERASQELGDHLRRELESIAGAAGDTVRTYSGPMTTDDLARAIERVVAPRQTALQQSLRRRQEAVIAAEVGRAERRLSRPLETFHRSVDEKFGTSLGYTVSSRFDVSSATVAPVDDSDATAVVGGLGAGAVAVGLLHLAFPWAAVAALVVGGLIKEASGQRKPVDPRAHLKAVVGYRYLEPIPGVVSEFRRRWREVSSTVVESLTREFERRLEDLIRKMESLLAEREARTQDVDAAHAAVAGMRSQLSEARSALNSAKEVITSL